MTSKRKKVDITKTGDSIVSKNASWSFGGNVAKHFDAHVRRSVPLYEEGHDLIGKISDFFLSNESKCYDLGCSTGKLIYELEKNIAGKTLAT